MTVKDPAEAAARALTVDPRRSNIICAIGRKGSGKSAVCRVIFDAWPYDRAVIDVTGDAKPVTREPVTALTAPMPASMPDPEDGWGRVTAWARIDPRRGETRFEADQDDALQLGLYPRRRKALVWVDEYAAMGTATRMGANLANALRSSRHYACSLVLAFPRPRFIPRLTLEQADKIFVFVTPDEDDRRTIANNIGYPFKLFDRHYRETMARGEHSFLLWDSRQFILFGCPPLPVTAYGPPA